MPSMSNRIENSVKSSINTKTKNIDARMEAQSKKILNQRIKFVEATQQQSPLDQLRIKYLSAKDNSNHHYQAKPVNEKRNGTLQTTVYQKNSHNKENNAASVNNNGCDYLPKENGGREANTKIVKNGGVDHGSFKNGPVNNVGVANAVSANNAISSGSTDRAALTKSAAQLSAILPANGEVVCDLGLTMHWTKIRGPGVGIVNVGNTCFLNSVLQALTYTAPLRHYLASKSHKCNGNFKNNFCMLCELNNHMSKAFNSVHSPTRPSNIYSKLTSIAKHMRLGRQEDAHEFLRYVINACKGTNNKKANLSISQMFSGKLLSQVVCSQCHYISKTYDPFMDLSLDLRNCSTIKNSLELYTKPEILSNENAYTCDRCKRRVRAEKSFKIQKAPNILTLHLKRFSAHSMKKQCKPIAFKQTLDLRPYMSDKNGVAIFYKLYAIIIHIGEYLNQGHYVCYAKAADNLWYCFNDSHVRVISTEIVCKAQAYVLMYKRKTPANSIMSVSPKISVIKKIDNNNNNGNRNNTNPDEKKTSQKDKIPSLIESDLYKKKNNVQIHDSTKSSIAVDASKSNGEIDKLTDQRRKKQSQLQDDIAFLNQIIGKSSKANQPKQSNVSPQTLQTQNASENNGINGVKSECKSSQVSAKCLRNRTKRRNRQLKKQAKREEERLAEEKLAEERLAEESSGQSELLKKRKFTEDPQTEEVKVIKKQKFSGVHLNNVQDWDKHLKKPEKNTSTEGNKSTWNGNMSSSNSHNNNPTKLLMANRSFGTLGSNVESWDGSANANDKSIAKERQQNIKNNRAWEKMYDQEIDAGKTKKFKKKIDNGNNNIYNKFQKFQDYKKTK